VVVPLPWSASNQRDLASLAVLELHVPHVQVDIVLYAIPKKKILEQELAQSVLVLMVVAQHARSNLVNRTIHGLHMQIRTVSDLDQVHYVVGPIAEGGKATTPFPCHAKASAVDKLEVVGDKAPSFVKTVNFDLFSLVYDWACGGCASGGHVDNFVFWRCENFCQFRQKASFCGPIPFWSWFYR
jgi:hypothetical protein